jgi:putative aminopeptidase FrvX
MAEGGRRYGGRAVGKTALVAFALTAIPPYRPAAESVQALAHRLAAMTAVTGFEQALGDTLLAMLPGAARDATGDVTITLGKGEPRRLVYCAMDEAGYVVGGVTPDGYLTLRRVGRATDRLSDQQLEGHRVTVFGDRGAVPGVVGVRSIHLAFGRGATPTDRPFNLDDAYVDVGASSVVEVAALGVHLLSPLAQAKHPVRYGDDLLAAPVAGRRAACAALLAAARSRPRTHGTVVVAFTAQSLLGGAPGLGTVLTRQGPFADTLEATLPVRFAGSAVETVSLKAARALADDLTQWMGAP